MKLCKDCKYYRRVYMENECAKDARIYYDPIHGEIYELELTRCFGNRNSDLQTKCGPEARFFEAKPTLLGKLKELMNKCKPS